MIYETEPEAFKQLIQCYMNAQIADYARGDTKQLIRIAVRETRLEDLHRYNAAKRHFIGLTKKNNLKQLRKEIDDADSLWFLKYEPIDELVTAFQLAFDIAN